MTNKYLDKVEEMEKEASIGSFFRIGATKAKAPVLSGATRVAPSMRAAEQGMTTQKVVANRQGLKNRFLRSADKSPIQNGPSTAVTPQRSSTVDMGNLDTPTYMRRQASAPAAVAAPEASKGSLVDRAKGKWNSMTEEQKRKAKLGAGALAIGGAGYLAGKNSSSEAPTTVSYM